MMMSNIPAPGYFVLLGTSGPTLAAFALYSVGRFLSRLQQVLSIKPLHFFCYLYLHEISHSMIFWCLCFVVLCKLLFTTIPPKDYRWKSARGANLVCSFSVHSESTKRVHTFLNFKLLQKAVRSRRKLLALFLALLLARK